MCVIFGSLHKTLLHTLMMRKIPSCSEKGGLCHLSCCDRRENDLKINSPPVPQQSICISQTRKEIINAKLFQANQIHVKNKHPGTRHFCGINDQERHTLPMAWPEAINLAEESRNS